MRSRALALVVVLMIAPLGAQAADLVVWWDEGYYHEEHEVVEEIVAAFEQETGPALYSSVRHRLVHIEESKEVSMTDTTARRARGR